MKQTPREFAVEVARRLQEAGFEALWAGGCVRDQLLGSEPKDYDVATSATPDQIRELFGRKRTLAIGAAFGVITVLGPKSAGNVEVATFRQDAEYSDGRHPDAVRFSTSEMDAQRRDFTINGVFFDPIAEQVIDYVNGQQDLRQQVVRAIGRPELRIAEDKLRMLRAVRFAATLEFQLEQQTLQTIREHAPEIHVVSAERIAGELHRMLVHPTRRRAVELLGESGLLTEILPVTQSLQDDTSQMDQTMSRLEQLSQPTLAVVLAVLLEAVIQPGDMVTLCRNLRLSNETASTAEWILQSSPLLAQADRLPWSTVQPLLVDSRINQALQFVEARKLEPGFSTAPGEFCRRQLQRPATELNPPMLVTGDDLREHGFQPGPDFASTLREIRRAQLDQEISSADEAMQIAQHLLARPE
ncbi:MAG: CCA tRNA nucleotidyltransferase [Pirellulaceae bacterium]